MWFGKPPQSKVRHSGQRPTFVSALDFVLIFNGLCMACLTRTVQTERGQQKCHDLFWSTHAACKKKQGKLNFKIFKGSSNILLPYHFQSDEWLMPNKPCWQTCISFLQLCVLQWLQCYMTSEVQILFKILSRNIKMSADERLGHLQMLWEIKILTLAWSLHIFTDLLKIYIQQNTLHSWVWPYSAKQGRMPLFSKYLEFSWGKQYFSPPNYLQNTNSFSWETNLLSKNIIISLLPLLLTFSWQSVFTFWAVSGPVRADNDSGPHAGPDLTDWISWSAQASQGWRWLTGSHITREARGGAQKWWKNCYWNAWCFTFVFSSGFESWTLHALNNCTHCIFIQLIALQHCITARRQWHRYCQANVIS